MQEYGWFHWHAFRDMVGVVGREPNSRKLRLAGCACVRRVWDQLEDPRLRAAVELAEDFADFRANKQQLKVARQAIANGVDEDHLRVVQDKSLLPEWVSDPDGAAFWSHQVRYELPIARAANLVTPLLSPRNFEPDSLASVATAAEHAADRTTTTLEKAGQLRWAEAQAQCQLLRDIFGNPFRSITFDPMWRTDTAMLLSKGIYESRDFSAMPILADALQDAGCDNDDILNHCRGAKQVHVRGCWVVDLVLGKE